MECADPKGHTYTDDVHKHHRDIALSPQDFQNLITYCKNPHADKVDWEELK